MAKKSGKHLDSELDNWVNDYFNANKVILDLFEIKNQEQLLDRVNEIQLKAKDIMQLKCRT